MENSIFPIHYANAKFQFPEVMISDKDRGNVRTPHDDPLVVEMKVANMKVKRILIDTGSSSDIISYGCLRKLKYDATKRQVD